MYGLRFQYSIFWMYTCAAVEPPSSRPNHTPWVTVVNRIPFIDIGSIASLFESVSEPNQRYAYPASVCISKKNGVVEGTPVSTEVEAVAEVRIVAVQFGYVDVAMNPTKMDGIVSNVVPLGFTLPKPA